MNSIVLFDKIQPNVFIVLFFGFWLLPENFSNCPTQGAAVPHPPPGSYAHRRRRRKLEKQEMLLMLYWLKARLVPSYPILLYHVTLRLLSSLLLWS